ncbi:MAG: metallophosphoesterase family protein [Hyphomicrobium sp.]
MIRNLFQSRTSAVRKEPARLPNGVRVYAVGDIHGCLDQLQRLESLIDQHAAAHPVSETHIVYLGDYVDRGPKSAEVIEYLNGVRWAGVTRQFLKGNHEAMLENFLADARSGVAWRQLGGLETMISYRVDVSQSIASGKVDDLHAAFLKVIPSKHLVFFDKLALSWSFGDYFFCHAGVKPGVPLEKQSPDDLLWIRDEFLASSEDFGKVVVHGHTPVAAVAQHPNRINVDTGAYATGVLSCLILEGDRRSIMTSQR